MEKIIDAAFRTICYKYGADLTFTELIRFETLAKNNRSALKRIKLYDETPTMIQFMGTNEDKLKKFLDNFNPTPGFKGFNFNLGCPSQNYVNSGVGSRMISRPTKTQRLVSIVQDYGYPVNIKMRLGMTRQETLDKVYLKLIEKVNADFFVVHARYRSQSYKVPPKWDIFVECVATGKEIIANGDIKSHEDVNLLEEMGCSGVMIGRQAIINPLIFGQLKNLNSLPTLKSVFDEYITLAGTREMNYSKRLFEIRPEDLPNLKG